MKKKLLSLLLAFIGLTATAQTEQIYCGFTATAGTTGYTNQSYEKLVDGKFTGVNTSKWCVAMSSASVPTGDTQSGVYIDFYAAQPIAVTKYILTTGEDNEKCKNRNPKSWVLRARASESDGWITIDSIANDTTMKDVNYKDYEFTLDEPGTYKYFRFIVMENKGDNSLQLCELRFKGALQTTTLAGAGTASSPYIIADLAGWNTFATNVNNGVNADKYYKLADSFYSDVPITLMAGTSEHPFAGHFNGNGKTLNVNIFCTEQGGAPFHYIDGATIEMLTVTGMVTGTEYHAAGLVGFCKDNNPNVIQYCSVETNVFATGYGGGLVGHGGNGTLTIEHCDYSGKISSFVNFAGGLLGWCDNVTVTMNDCLFKGSFSAGSSNGIYGKYHPIAGHTAGTSASATCTNVYYLGNDATANANNRVPGANGLKVTSSMPSNTMCLIANAADGNSYYSATSVSGVESFYEFTGSVVQPVPTVKLSDGSVVPTSCYTVTYSGDETTPGTYSVTISGVSSEGYEGTTVINYDVTYAKPTNVAVSLTCAQPTQATISWTENGSATQWKICLNGNESGAITVNTNPYTLTELEAEHGYNVKVCAIGELADSYWSDEVYFMPTEMVTVGMGSETASELPMNCYYKYGLTEQIYTAAELEASVNADKAIESISFNCAKTPSRELDIYIVHTNKSAFSSTTDWIIPTANDKVFSGTVNFESNGWTAITLDNPFVYDGTSNIAIMIDDNTGSYTATTNFLAYSCTGYQTLYAKSDETNYAPMAPPSGYTLAMKNQMRVRFGEAASVARPSGLTATLTPGNGTVATLSWTENGTATQWQICLNEDEEHLITVNTNPYSLTNLTPETEYTAKVRAVNNGEYSFWSNTITFTPTNLYVLTVNDNTTANGYVPIYGYWADQLTASQFIIEAADLSVMEYGNVNKLTFYSSDSSKSWGDATFDVYLGEVDQATFSSANFVDWSTLTKVYSGSASITNGKMEITLDDTYQYMGGNLLVGFNQTVTGSYSSVNWYGVTKTSASVGGYTSHFSVQDFLPKTTFTYVPGTLPTCFKPKDLAVVGEPAARSVQLQWTAGSTDQTAWDVAYKADGDADFTIVEGVTSNPYTLTGLQQDTHYTVKVRGNCGGGDVSDWSKEVSFATDVAFPAPENMKVSDVEPHSAVVSWETKQAKRFNLRYKKLDASTLSTIMLKADDVWGDGTGYQMLLDADATAYGDVIPAIDSGIGYLDDAGVYAQFEYKIPENADGELTTSNIVLDDSVTIMIPPGTYDWCITNPTPGDRLWIASSNGSIAGRADDYVFEPAKIYKFHTYMGNNGNDAVELTVTDNPSAVIGGDTDWTIVNNVTTPYSLTGLDAACIYVVQVQCVYDDGMSQWSFTTFVTPKENPVPFNVDVTEGHTSAYIAWKGFGDSYNVKYREEGTEDWTTVNTTEKSISITGLDPVTTYEYQIQSVKGVETSDWTTLDTFTTLNQKLAGDVNDDARFSIADVTMAVNLIKAGGYDAAADLNGDNVVDENDLDNLVNVKILDIQMIAPVVSVKKHQAPKGTPTQMCKSKKVMLIDKKVVKEEQEQFKK